MGTELAEGMIEGVVKDIHCTTKIDGPTSMPRTRIEIESETPVNSIEFNGFIHLEEGDRIHAYLTDLEKKDCCGYRKKYVEELSSFEKAECIERLKGDKIVATYDIE